MSDIASFLAGAGQAGLGEWQRQKQEISQEEKERRKVYLQLLMSGDYTEPEAREISGYKGVTGREAPAVQSALRRREEPARKEEAILGQLLEAKRTGTMPEEGEMSPGAFKIYTDPQYTKVLGAEKRGRVERAKTEEERGYRRKQKLFDQRLRKELAVFKAGLKDEDEEKLSEVEKNLKYLKKKYTTLKTASEAEKAKWSDLGLDVETMTYREFLENLSDVWTKEVESELGRIGGGDPKNRQELLNSFKSGGYNRITNREGLKAQFEWLTDQDIDWIEGQL